MESTLQGENSLKLRISLTLLLLLSSYLTFLAPMSSAIKSYKDKVQILQNENGIRIVVKNNFELYFNASNGGEITEYFDLNVDPSRLRNLVNLGWKPYYNLLPFFTSLFYRPPYPEKVFSTGGDANARLWLIGNTSEYVILQSSSRILDRFGRVARDVYGNVIFVNSSWIIRSSGLVSVERTFFSPAHVAIPAGWRWYPFYLTRRAGFNYNGTYYMFNTTHAYSSVVNEGTYKDIFSLFSPLQNDTNHIFGVAMPFSNTSIGGDGAHNILIAYKYDELVNVNEWRSDNYHSGSNNITEGGALHEFNTDANVSTHTYRVLMNFTHQPVNEQSVQDFARYYVDNVWAPYLLQANLTTDKSTYGYGEPYTVYGSGISYYNLTGLTAKLTVKNDGGKVIFVKNYGPGSLTAGQKFSTTLLSGTVTPGTQKGNYTLIFQILSPFGIVIASSSKVITVTAP